MIMQGSILGQGGSFPVLPNMKKQKVVSAYTRAMMLPILLGAFGSADFMGTEKPVRTPKRQLPSEAEYRRQNGSRECARRRRQIEKGMLKV